MRILLITFLMQFSASTLAGPADVIDVDTQCNANLCRFQVTVRHADEGWDHYADAILVLSENGKLLGNRPLRHPHVGQASFTRTVQILIPESESRVIIVAHDSVHGDSGETMTVRIPR